MSTYLNMPQPSVTLPIFGSSGQSQGDAGGWQMDASGDPMDFDLLAEYLLDDSNENPSGVSFDFK
jgi:hypothetical protein